MPHGKLFIDRNKPLLFNLRLDHATAAFVGGDVVCVALINFLDESLGLHFLNNGRPGFFDVHAGKLTSNFHQAPPLINNLLYIEVVPLRDLEVDSTVPRGDSHDARAHLRVGCFVFNNGGGNRTVDPLNINLLAMFVLGVALVVGVHHHVLVAKLSLRAHRANRERAVLKIVEGTVLFFVDDLVVRHRCLHGWVPVHAAGTAVNKSVIVHTNKGLHDRVVAGFIKRKGIAAPIETRAHFLGLANDGVFALFSKSINTF